jgi:O-antigen/teichoic acid export membrane protein
LFLFTVAWLFFSRISLTQVVVLSLIGNAATLLLGLILLWRSVAALGPEKGSNPSLSQEIFPLAIPLWISSLAFLLLNQADIFMLGTLRSEQEVAVYGIALRLAQLISVPLFMFNAVLPPIIAKLYIQGEKKQLERVLRIAASLAFIFSVLCTILFMVFGGDLLTLLFGKTYVQAYWLLIILSIGQVVNVATGSCGMLLMMSGYHRQYMTITLVNGGFCIVLLYLLIPQVGSLGAAIAVTLDIILFMGMAAFYAWYRTDIRTWPFSPIGIVRQARKGFK